MNAEYRKKTSQNKSLEPTIRTPLIHDGNNNKLNREIRKARFINKTNILGSVKLQHHIISNITYYDRF
jgi:hypothetical protein